MSNEVAKQIQELVELINTYDQAYYVQDRPDVSDAMYDESFRKLQALEAQYPQYLTSSSPTQKVGGRLKEGFNAVQHRVPMLSIKTETSPSLKALDDWHTSLAKQLNLSKQEVPLIVEQKYDGLALSLQYEDGIIVSAATRGDGTTGEDVFLNALYIEGVPSKLHKGSDSVVIRGEVVMTKESFRKLNETQDSLGKKRFINPRNAAAGTLRSHDSKVVAERGLRFIPYGVFGGSLAGSNCTEQSDYLNVLEDYGFQTSGYFLLPKEYRDLESKNNFGFMQVISDQRAKLPYEIDGLVYKVNNLEQQRLLGSRNREPVWAIAYKFPPEKTTTALVDIDIQVGRTGKLTPVAKLYPVFVGGTTISNVTLHNVFDLRKRKVRVGDVVVVQRAGDVIPEIVGPELDYRKKYLANFHMPKECPVCSGIVRRQHGEREYRCMNTLGCSAQAQQAMLHYSSKLAMAIDGLGEKTVKELFELKLVNGILDIYKLTASILFRKAGMGEKTVSNLLDAIEKSKDTTFQKFIYSLGISNVGEGTSKMLAKHYVKVEDLIKATKEDFMTMPDIGPIVAGSLVEFFLNPVSQDMALTLQNRYLRIGTPRLKTDKLKGLSFVFTGTFDGVSRDQLKATAEENGGINSNSVSKKTSFLVAGGGGGSKSDDAKKHGVPIITQEAFLNMVT